MNKANPVELTADIESDESTFDFIDLLTVFAKHKKFILGAPLAVAIAAAAASFLLPDVYRTSTKLLPPQQAQSGAAALLSQLGGVAGMAAGASGLKSPNDLYVGMLKSRSISDKLVAQFSLNKVYDINSKEKTRTQLEDRTFISVGKDGLITIEVEDENRDLVAPLANAYVSELIKLTKDLALTEASQRRLFFERQLEQSKDNLASAEVKLKQSMDKHGVISVDGDSRAIIETVGRLRAQMSAKEIQLNSMRAFVTVDNPAFKRVVEESNSLREELSKLENGRPELVDSSGTSTAKNDGLENIKTLRDVKYHQMLYELLAKQYEMARLDEAKDPSIIQVLDTAVPPEKKFRPKRALIAALGAVLALIIALIWAFLAEARQRVLAAPLQAVRLEKFESFLRIW